MISAQYYLILDTLQFLCTLEILSLKEIRINQEKRAILGVLVRIRHRNLSTQNQGNGKNDISISLGSNNSTAEKRLTIF